MQFWNRDRQAESKSTVDQVVAERRNRVAALVAETEALIEHARQLIAADADVGKRYAVSVITPWRDEITQVFQAFRDAVVGSLPALREATRLVGSGDARIAVEKYGPLLANIRSLEASLGELKRQRPTGLSRVGLHEVVQGRRHPSQAAEQILEVLLAGAPQSDFGLVTIDDVISRLKIEEGGVDSRDFQLHRGTYVEWVWNAQAVTVELEKLPQEVATA